MSAKTIIMDDGEFFIELNVNYKPNVAPGYLGHRCLETKATPLGLEVIGSFDREPDGSWKADIQGTYDAITDSDCLVIAKNVSRLDAITCLWNARKRAHIAAPTKRGQA